MTRTVSLRVTGSILVAATIGIAAAATAGTPEGFPTLSKSFSPATINDGQTTLLSFLVVNTPGSPDVSNAGFVDNLPAGIVIANPPSVGGTCANAAAATTASAGGTTITVTGLDVPAGPTGCVVTVHVTNATGQTNESCGANPAAFTNGPTDVSATNLVNGVQPTCLVVHATEPPPPAPVVPALSPGMLVLLATGLAGIGVVALRRFPG